ncbi:MAG: polysaccharide pyruvyl transferase family protein [Solirubrobacterales bacterium]
MIPTRPAFFASPQTIDAVGRAHSVAFLIGGYDGSGNFGDLLQLDAALALLGRLEPGLLPLPVLERSRIADHRDLADSFLQRFPHAIFIASDGDHEDELLPLPAPAGLPFAALYLYGGGYLNPSWGERRLAMLRDAEALLGEAEVTTIRRLSSGLQVDPGWIGDLDEADAERLRRFELLGARDRRSAEALAALGAAGRVVETADDAVGALRKLRPDAPTTDADERLRLNLHIAEHPWVSERPQAIAEFHAGLAGELGRGAGRPVLVQPLVAYDDRRVNEREALDRLAAACAARGVELAAPRVLLPTGLAPALTAIGAAELTISCSYHVALTSLLLGVPAILLGDNAYYEQKAAGLAEAFDLPPSFALRSSMDPGECARQIAAAVLGEGRAALRFNLALRASWMRERRADAEAELLADLGGGLGAGLGGRIDELATRLRQRSAEPAELLARLSALETDEESPPPPAPGGQPGEGAAQLLLDEITASRSWRMTAPLRRIGALLRPRRRG